MRWRAHIDNTTRLTQTIVWSLGILNDGGTNGSQKPRDWKANFSHFARINLRR